MASVHRRSIAAPIPAGLLFCTSGCARGVLDPQGPVAAAEKTILLNSVGIMLTVVVPVIAATLAVAWWFRASNERAVYRPDWDYSGKIEIVIWAIPAMIVLLLGGIAWIGSHDLAPERPIASRHAPIEVQVVALDWKWLFIYPQQGVASVNYVAAPAGTPVRFRLTSATVMNSFFVPQLGSQIYAMSGMTTRLNLLADKPGQYQGLSSQFSGDGFSGMRFKFDAMPPGGFEAWVAKAKAKGGALDAAGYAMLAKPSMNLAPTTYGTIDPGLFERIADGKSAASLFPFPDPHAGHGASSKGQ